MSYKIDFGGWESVFAVPTALVDKGLKLAGETQLKVLLYILRNSQGTLSDESIAEALSLHKEDVSDAVEFWAQRGLLVNMGDKLTLAKAEEKEASAPSSKPVETAQNSQTQRVRLTSRPMKPEPAYVIKRIRSDSGLAVLMDEAQRILNKMLSNTDMGTLVMLHDTDGLPVDVIIMLMEHCVNIGKGTMRYVESTGLAWAREGINTLPLAEEKIKRQAESSDAWKKVSAVFGLKLSGTPTKKQLEYSDMWVNEWKFSEELIRLAYEKCVDTKTELNMSYINGILKKWHAEGIKSAKEVSEAGEKSKQKRQQKLQEASYDLDSYESTSMFD
ncbi:MAG: DnaD domain protein [Eubacteriales bacterium]|nr:DnaD domain protein [Eubacteriales bacterium]